MNRQADHRQLLNDFHLAATAIVVLNENRTSETGPAGVGMSDAWKASFNRLRAALTAREPRFGVIVTMPSVQVVQTLASAGVDWIIIDKSPSAFKRRH